MKTVQKKLEDMNKRASWIRAGNVKEMVETLKKQWAHERGERVVAEIGDESQEYEYQSVRRNRDIKIRKKGWRAILLETGIGVKRFEGGEAWVVMLSGGYDSLGSPDNLEFVVSVYNQEGKRVGEAMIVKDEYVREKPKGSAKNVARRVTSAMEDLERVVSNLEIREETKKVVTFGTGA